MPSQVGVAVDGTITAGVGTTSSGSCSAPTTSSPGVALGFALKSAHMSADWMISQALDEVDSPTPVSLPLPTGAQGTVFYLRILDNGSLDIVVTHDDQGATTYPVQGMILIEPTDDEFITAVTVTGEAQFEWLMTGDRA